MCRRRAEFHSVWTPEWTRRLHDVTPDAAHTECGFHVVESRDDRVYRTSLRIRHNRASISGRAGPEAGTPRQFQARRRPRLA